MGTWGSDTLRRWSPLKPDLRLLESTVRVAGQRLRQLLAAVWLEASHKPAAAGGQAQVHLSFSAQSYYKDGLQWRRQQWLGPPQY